MMLFQHTAARRRLGNYHWCRLVQECFNTQPPEGGWISYEFTWVPPLEFQHTAARRRLG